MSRCFPYTRPIYKREDVSLIGSIKKLQIQWANTKQRKQLVNEKQNKKRSREEHDKLDPLQRKNKKRKADKNLKYIESSPYASKGDSDHLERSDLSEEHDPPALVLSQCNSSKCDSIKKKQGLVIRIKLPLQKHEDVVPESASTDPYRTSQFTQSSKAPPFLTDAAPSCSSQVSKSSKAPVFVEPNPGESRLGRSRGRSCTQRLERQLFRDLIQKWKPPSIQPIPANEEGELDWLSAARRPRDAKTSISDAATWPSSASSLQPRATYLPELAMYQMPYVIPF